MTWTEAINQIRKDKKEAEKMKQKRDELIWTSLESFTKEYKAKEDKECSS